MHLYNIPEIHPKHQRLHLLPYSIRIFLKNIQKSIRVMIPIFVIYDRDLDRFYFELPCFTRARIFA